MKAALTLAAVGEVLTGLALLVDPSRVGRLLLGAELEGAAAVVGRVTGLALIGLGVACGPFSGPKRAHLGMLTYSALVTVYLARLGLADVWAGPALWPAVALHALFALLLLRAWWGRSSAAD